MKHALKLMTAACVFALAACSPSTPLPKDAPAETGAATPPAVETPVATPETAPAETPVSTAAPADDTCELAKYASLVGKPATDSAVPPAGPGVRHIKPDTQVTMDFRPDRLNIDINAEGVITGMKSG